MQQSAESKKFFKIFPIKSYFIPSDLLLPVKKAFACLISDNRILVQSSDSLADHELSESCTNKISRQMLKTHEKVLHLLSVLKNGKKGIDKTK